ncbi:hypothetical protein [Planosporangium mesophilum]|nr:hypothetical protein [Planosporangium mesophilum]
MSDEAPVRVGLRAKDVSAAAALYESFGFVRSERCPDRTARW